MGDDLHEPWQNETVKARILELAAMTMKEGPEKTKTWEESKVVRAQAMEMRDEILKALETTPPAAAAPVVAATPVVATPAAALQPLPVTPVVAAATPAVVPVVATPAGAVPRPLPATPVKPVVVPPVPREQAPLPPARPVAAPVVATPAAVAPAVAAVAPAGRALPPVPREQAPLPPAGPVAATPAVVPVVAAPAAAPTRSAPVVVARAEDTADQKLLQAIDKQIAQLSNPLQHKLWKELIAKTHAEWAGENGVLTEDGRRLFSQYLQQLRRQVAAEQQAKAAAQPAATATATSTVAQPAATATTLQIDLHRTQPSARPVSAPTPAGRSTTTASSPIPSAGNRPASSPERYQPDLTRGPTTDRGATTPALPFFTVDKVQHVNDGIPTAKDSATSDYKKVATAEATDNGTGLKIRVQNPPLTPEAWKAITKSITDQLGNEEATMVISGGSPAEVKAILEQLNTGPNKNVTVGFEPTFRESILNNPAFTEVRQLFNDRHKMQNPGSALGAVGAAYAASSSGASSVSPQSGTSGRPITPQATAAANTATSAAASATESIEQRWNNSKEGKAHLEMVREINTALGKSPSTLTQQQRVDLTGLSIRLTGIEASVTEGKMQFVKAAKAGEECRKEIDKILPPSSAPTVRPAPGR